MRRVYVLNLDQKRLMIVTGVALSLLGSAIFAGMSLGKSDEIIPPPMAGNEASPFNIENSESIENEIQTRQHEAQKQESSSVVVKLDADPMLPELEKKSGVTSTAEKSSDSNSLKVVTDPFVSPPPKKETNTKTVSTEKSGHYVIQIAAFKHERQAKTMVSRLKKDGFNARVVRGTRFWLVRMGASSVASNLESRARKLKSAGYEALIRKI